MRRISDMNGKAVRMFNEPLYANFVDGEVAVATTYHKFQSTFASSLKWEHYIDKVNYMGTLCVL